MLREADSLHFSNEADTSAESISPLGPLMMSNGQLDLPELDASVYSFVAKWQKE